MRIPVSKNAFLINVRFSAFISTCFLRYYVVINNNGSDSLPATPLQPPVNG